MTPVSFFWLGARGLTPNTPANISPHSGILICQMSVGDWRCLLDPVRCQIGHLTIQYTLYTIQYSVLAIWQYRIEYSSVLGIWQGVQPSDSEVEWQSCREYTRHWANEHKAVWGKVGKCYMSEMSQARLKMRSPSPPGFLYHPNWWVPCILYVI